MIQSLRGSRTRDTPLPPPDRLRPGPFADPTPPPLRRVLAGSAPCSPSAGRGPFKSGPVPFTLCLHNTARPYHLLAVGRGGEGRVRRRGAQPRPPSRGRALLGGEWEQRGWAGPRLSRAGAAFLLPPPTAASWYVPLGAPPPSPGCSGRCRAAGGSVRGSARSPLGTVPVSPPPPLPPPPLPSGGWDCSGG